MKKTRTPGVFRTPDGRYRLRVTAVSERTGKLREAMRTLSAGATEEDALEALLQLKRELKRDQADEAIRPKPTTLADYAEQWLEVRSARVKPAVANRYAETLARHILPTLGEKELDTITRSDIERWVVRVEQGRRSDGQLFSKETLRGWWQILATVLKDAVAELGLPNDPTLRVRPPKTNTGRRREHRTLSADELGALVEGVKRFSPDRYAEAYVLAYTGMRVGELFALSWEDLDRKAGCIHVRKSVWRGQVTTVKTGDPRDVALPEEMLQVLDEHKKRLNGRRRPDPTLVFPSDVGTHRNAASLHKPLALAAEAAGITVKVTPQVLRRTFNTLMLKAGVDRIVLRSQMGHCSEAMTARYAGIDIQAKHEALRRLLPVSDGASSAARSA